MYAKITLRVVLLCMISIGMNMESPAQAAKNPTRAHRGPTFRLEMEGNRSGMRNGEQLTITCDDQLIVRLILDSASRDEVRYLLDLPDAGNVAQNLYAQAKGKSADIIQFHEIGTRPEVVLAYRYLFHIRTGDGKTFAALYLPAATYDQWSIKQRGDKWCLVRKMDRDLYAALTSHKPYTAAEDCYISVNRRDDEKDDLFYMNFRAALPWPPFGFVSLGE